MKTIFYLGVLILIGTQAHLPAYAAPSVRFMSSKAGNTEHHLPGSIPQDAVMIAPDPDEVFERQERSRSCLQIYGSPSHGVSYTGGPWNESRFATGYLKDSVSGRWQHDAKGDLIKDWSAWAKTEQSLPCFRHHDYVRMSACPSGQKGHIIERRRFVLDDQDQIVEDSDWIQDRKVCNYTD